MKKPFEIKSNKGETIKYLVIAVFIILLFILHSRIVPNFGDDLTYIKVWNEKSLGLFLKDRYQWWSSRVIIEAIMMLLIAASPWVWRIFNIIIILLFIWNISDLFGNKDKKLSFILFGMLMWIIPLPSLYSAGWITTTTNYLWSLSLGSIALRPIAYCLMDRKNKKWEYICYPLCAIYSANMEQMAAILLGAYLVFGVYLLIQKKKISPLFLIQLLLIVLSLCFILASPGNNYRNSYEMERYFPEFGEMNIVEKILMGFIETFYYYLAGGHGNVCYLVAGISGILLFLFLTTFNNKKYRNGAGLIITFPFLSYWCFTYLFPYLLYDINIGRFRRAMAVLSENSKIFGQSEYTQLFIMIQIFIYAIVLICIALSIFFIHGRTQETLLQLIILAAGFSSRVIIGFSPTIYASGDRTALFCSAAILIVTYRNILFGLKQNLKREYYIFYIVYMALLICLSIIKGY